MTTYEDMYQDIQPLIAGNKHSKAIGGYENLLEHYPDSAQGHNDLGVLYYKIGNREKALIHLRKAATIEPGNIVYLKNMADFLYSEMGEVKDAFDWYQRVLEIKPDDIESLMISGHICISEHHFDDAKAFYRKVLDLEPWNDDAWNFLENLESHPQNSQIKLKVEEKYQKCQHLVNSENKEAAIQAFQDLIEIYPDFAPAYNDLGVLHYQTGNKEVALKNYEKAALLEPNNMILQKNLADFYFVELGRIENALEIYAKVLSEEPADVDCLMAAGHISGLLDLRDDARIFYERILDIEPWNLEAEQRLNELSRNMNTTQDFSAQNVSMSPDKSGLTISFE